MKTVSVFVILLNVVKGYYYSNTTYSDWQLQGFKDDHPVPIGCLTTSAGEPVDLRDTLAINNDFFTKEYYLDAVTHLNREKIPEREVHAKGTAVHGFFEVTNDVSKYTKADVFNGVGKKTRAVMRFSANRPRVGGTELLREFKGLGVKLYTKDGNLDYTCLQTPIFIYKSPVDFHSSTHSVKLNPRTNLIDDSMQWDFTSLKPDRMLTFLWLFADYGIPKNFRTMDVFPIHTYEINNEHGESYFVKFNFRTEQGLQFLTTNEAYAVASEDSDHYTRDLYNAISRGEYPVWRLDMDVMSVEDVKKLDFDPFDITRLWRNGTFHTVTIGRLVANATATNHFRDSEQSLFNPGSLVPGITGPHDFVFKGRRLIYRDTQLHRLGVNNVDIEVNTPKYRKTYRRDGVAPVRENMHDAPNYYPNSFNGAIPYVDEKRPQKLLVMSNNAVDLEKITEFYEKILLDDAHRQRLADNIALTLEPIAPNVATRVIKILTLAHPELGERIHRSLTFLKEISEKQTTTERYNNIAQCLERNVANGFQKPKH